MKIKTFFYFFMITCATLLEGRESEEIVVQLPTETPLMPLYLGKFVTKNAGFDTHYLEKLENILRFDLSHNGMTKLISVSAEKEKLLTTKNLEDEDSASAWKDFSLFHVVKITVANKQLTTNILAVANNTLKTSESISLTGDLAQDRRLIHQLADTIHTTLFGKEGITTTRFLYTVKLPTKEKGKWLSEVWEADYDGANARQITQGEGYCITPAYIPSTPGYRSGSFFYVSYQLGQPKIFMKSLQGGTGKRLSYLKGNQLMPAISKQRNNVAFICDVTGNPDLFLQPFSTDVGALGKPQQIFTSHNTLATQASPTFSPDGKRIAFVSNKDGSPRIYVMDIPPPGAELKNLEPTLISRRNRESTAPSWSPDGTKLAYCALTKGVRQIWIYDFTTREERQLTQGPGHKENPTWAPNSLHLIFNSADTNSSELYLVNLNQSEAHKISQGPGEKRFPNWEPK